MIPVGRWVLEGLSHRGERWPALLVLPPPPAEGGGMEHVLSAELVWAAARAGHPTLRFNYRGVGASQGERSSGGALVEDARAALGLLRENVGGQAPIALAALGGSAPVALKLARAEKSVAGLALVNPERLALDSLRRMRCAVLAVVAEDDSSLAPAALSSALAATGGGLEIIPGADRRFLRGLTQVGSAVATLLSRL